MKLSQVALQLYTLRDYTKTPTDIRHTLKRVRAIGYEAVQASGMGPIDDAELAEILRGEGLTLCATHEGSDFIRQEPEKVSEKLSRLNCKYTAYPFPAGVDWTKPADVESMVADLDQAAAVLGKAGHVLAYHNHAVELMPFQGATALDYIYAKSSLQGEIDTYWIQHGGGDPVAWCAKLAGRLPMIHMKDYTVLPSGKPDFAAIGAGNLNFPAIIAAAEKSGCQWFTVEQDTTPGNPFDAVKQSFEYIKANLVNG